LKRQHNRLPLNLSGDYAEIIVDRVRKKRPAGEIRKTENTNKDWGGHNHLKMTGKSDTCGGVAAYQDEID